MKDIERKLEKWFEKRHNIKHRYEYERMEDCTLGDRFDEILEFVNELKLK